MEKIELVTPKIEHENDAQEYIKELLKGPSDYLGKGDRWLHLYRDDYKNWLEKTEMDIDTDFNWIDRVSESTFFVTREYDKKIIGMINIRHKLNERFKEILSGGHIGYSVRPSEKEYETEILKKGLEKLKEIGMNKVLIICKKGNLEMIQAIQKNNGIFENEMADDGAQVVIQRYWIDINAIKE